jgi:hypothetical protein
MLLTRIITASILASLIAVAVFVLPLEYFALIIGAYHFISRLGVV